MKRREEDEPEQFRKAALGVVDRRASVDHVAHGVSVTRPRRATEAEVRAAFEKLSEQWEMLWELGDDTVRELMIKVTEKCQ